jgi:hypothetical protein
MKLIPVPSQFIDRAWFKEGASALAEACETSGGEITGDQLKMILARGERTLLRLDDDGQAVGWGVVRVDQLANYRVLHACELVAHNAHFERFYEALKGFASACGCSRIRCSAKGAQARLYRMKLGMTPVYETLEVVL